MVMELIWFLGGSLVLLVPGVWLAGGIGIGVDQVERWAYGSCLGLALSVYFASLISRIDLRGFYPVWGIFAMGCLSFRITKGAKHAISQSPLEKNRVILIVLVLVAVSRFGAALPQPLPEGSYDPTTHLVLAGRIQETQHSISDWEPFEPVALNYPTGSHTLIVVLSAISRLPLHVVFKDLIPLLGVLSTAQIFTFARRAAKDETIALWTAAIYGLWAWMGSIDYFHWGGLPNEMGMLFFLATLTLWIDDLGAGLRTILMAIFLAGMVLVHHHVMLVTGLVVLSLLAVPRGLLPPGSAKKPLIVAGILAGVLDGFFLIPYMVRAAALGSTTVLYDSEPGLSFREIYFGIGIVLAPFALGGVFLCCTRRRPRLHPVVYSAAGVLLGLFLLTEYVIPLISVSLGHSAAIAFAPSRFLTDLNYFLALFAAVLAAFVQSRLRINWGWSLAMVCALSMVTLKQWKELFHPTTPFAPPGFVDACRWIHDHTSASTVVLNRDNWTTYLAWRRATFTPLSGSDPIPNHQATLKHLAEITSGQIPPDSPDMTLVKILPDDAASDSPVVWRGSGYKVVRVWP